MQIKKIHIPNGLIVTLLIIVALNVAFYFVSPDVIVDYVGVENSYLTVFLIAAFGGLSSFTSAVFYSAVATFASGGASIWYLGLAGGIGIFIGDSIVFLLLSYGFKNASGKWNARVAKLKQFIEDYPPWVTYGLLFLLLGFTPIPNDIVLVALVLLGYTYRHIAPLLFASGITITTITAYFGESLFSYLF
jgi:hypothetical protein